MRNFTLRYTAASHPGQQQCNQDNLCIGREIPRIDGGDFFETAGALAESAPQMLCVCDGIGGGASGDLAAVLALEGVQAAACASGFQNDMEDLALRAAEEAQARVCSHFRHIGRSGGCTMTLAAVDGDSFSFLNIGDSPGFLFRGDDQSLTELSRRHNLEWHKRRMGVEPQAHDSHFLMRYIGKTGCSPSLMAHVCTGALRPGDRILLCSDGITNAIPAEQLQKLLAEGRSAADLVNRAAAYPGADNCTAIIFSVVGEKEGFHEREYDHHDFWPVTESV